MVSGCSGLDLAVTTDVPSTKCQELASSTCCEVCVAASVYFLLSWSEMFSQVSRSEVDVAQLPRIEMDLI